MRIINTYTKLSLTYDLHFYFMYFVLYISRKYVNEKVYFYINQSYCNNKGWQFLALFRDYHLANNLLSVIEIVTPSYDNFSQQ